jgi:hypothetical protein
VGATVSLWRNARKQNLPFWGPFMRILTLVPQVIGVFIVFVLYYIPAFFFRCLPISVKSRVRFARRYGMKAGQAVEEKSEMQMNNIKRKLERRDKDGLPNIVNSDGVSTHLAHFLAIYDILIMVTENLHYVDLLNLGLVSKSVRKVVQPTNAQQMIHLKMYTCHRKTKTQCWICTNLVCEVSQAKIQPFLSSFARIKTPLRNQTNPHTTIANTSTPRTANTPASSNKQHSTST